MKKLIGISLILFAFASLLFAQSERAFNSIVVRDERPGWRNIIIVDYDCEFAWVGRDFGDSRDFGGGTKPGIFVHSKTHDRWLQIVRVSTTGAKFGKAPEGARLQAGWDFTRLASQPFVPLPLTAGSLHLPEKVAYDETHAAFVLYFDSKANSSPTTTTILIPKKDLLDAFEYYSKLR